MDSKFLAESEKEAKMKKSSILKNIFLEYYLILKAHEINQLLSDFFDLL